MISFLLMFWNHVHPDNDKPVTILRTPRIKSLRALQLGLTLALIFSSLVILLNPFPGGSWQNLLTKILFLALLFAMTRLGGWFVFLMMILYAGFSIFSLFNRDIWNQIWFAKFCSTFGNSFLFGALLATIYNDLMYLHTRIFRRKMIKRSFTFHPMEKLDIIKSPIKNETAHNGDESHYDPVYNYNLDDGTIPKHPYTIAFVANPCIQISRNENVDAMPDPIMYDRDIFFSCVDKALASFESNEVLGRPEIWSRIRIMVFYDAQLEGSINPKCSFVKTFGPEIIQDNEKAEYLLYPQNDMRERLMEMIGDATTNTIKNIDMREIDVIYALSAHPTHIRSTARYSIYKFPENRKPIPLPNLYPIIFPKPKPLRKITRVDLPEINQYDLEGVKQDTTFPKDNSNNFYWLTSFFLNLRNFLTPAASLLQDFSFYPPIDQENKLYKEELLYPEDYADYPGLVALNIIGATSKTFIHEFAHAMSATGTGIIVDEFYDQVQFQDDASESSTPAQDDYSSAFYVNRLERKKHITAKDINSKYFLNNNLINEKIYVPPIPKEFRTYSEQIYNTDLNHPSAEENWLGYFPERPETAQGCTMDRTYGSYAFDKLLQKFIYDRILVKTNRKAPNHDAS